MSRKKLVEIFEKLNATDTEEIIKMSLGETLDMWKVILEWNENKSIPAKIDIDLGNLIHFYVVEYTCFSFSVNNKNICKETLLYSSLFAAITNTVFTIWKLASDGLDYSAKILLRNLLELILTTLTILLDKEKRIALMEFDLNKTDEVWYKHFSIKKMLSTISKCKQLEKTPFPEWVKAQYKNFSSYVHNNWGALLGFSRSVTDKKNNITHINICGNYATRAELLLSELADICCIFDLVFLSIYSDKKKDSNDTTFTVFLQDDEPWQNAMYLSKLNILYHKEIFSKKTQNDQL